MGASLHPPGADRPSEFGAGQVDAAGRRGEARRRGRRAVPPGDAARADQPSYTAPMRILGRLLLGSLALFLAIPSGGAILLMALVLDPVASVWLTKGALAGLDAGLSDLAAGLPPESFAWVLAGLAKASFVLLAVPPALVALVGETLRWRGLLWYGAGCGLITAALPWLARGAVRPGGTALTAEARVTAILFLAGAGAGLVYWLIAGRSAGRPPTRA
ncbi:hypothetical protein [Methylobacterium sp. J-092]|uniref:hypothetical protein n=1 Tax=Methylobacterium sp. J-092 TaxID=2836667 RepID=UPI0028C40C17|nr:hypothetical protein [Methylobacterium sp. J-092]